VGDGLRQVLEQSPPELVSDVIERGIVLNGGGALLRNLDSFLSDIADIPVAVAENPTDCVVIGTSKALDMVHVLSDGLVTSGGRR
jgi:rod shape-determining protein MreB